MSHLEFQSHKSLVHFNRINNNLQKLAQSIVVVDGDISNPILVDTIYIKMSEMITEYIETLKNSDSFAFIKEYNNNKNFLNNINYMRGYYSRFYILNRDLMICQICNSNKYKGNELQVDHIIPKSKGGVSHPINLQTLCIMCDKTKSDYIIQNTSEMIKRSKKRNKGLEGSIINNINNRDFGNRIDMIYDNLSKFYQTAKITNVEKFYSDIKLK